MTTSDWVNVTALIAGPLIGVFITIFYQRWQQKRRAELWVLGQLISNRHQILHSDNVRAMNTIDLVFAGNQKVRSAWAEFVEAMRNQSETDVTRQKKYNAMIDTICADLGYGNAIRYLDFDRVVFDPAPAQAKVLEQALLDLLKYGKTIVESEIKKLGVDSSKGTSD